MVAKEFDECLRAIVQLDYGLVLISHAVDKTFTDETGKEFNKIVPTLVCVILLVIQEQFRIVMVLFPLSSLFVVLLDIWQVLVLSTLLK